MGIPDEQEIIEDCVTCPVRKTYRFCNLTTSVAARLSEIAASAFYPKGAKLFTEGQQPKGVFVLCRGRVKLFTHSTAGKTIITKVSEAGDVLGLNAVVSNRPYEVTAEMLETGQASFIAHESLLELERDCGEVGLRIAEQLSHDCLTAHEAIRIFGLTSSPAQRFAMLLLSWWSETGANRRVAQVHLTLTHAEIAEIIGTTRETVSRLFSRFKEKGLLQRQRPGLTLFNRQALEKIAPRPPEVPQLSPLLDTEQDR